MPRRPVGRLLDLEYRILQACLDLEGAGEPVYGFALAQAMSGAGRDHGLVGHGTLYKALSRLSKMGLLESTWVVPRDDDLGRPRRRLYQVTGEGARVVSLRPADHTVLQAARSALA
jgi:DNA-binding PadR family transcriptional regulator